jgi:cytochrome P450
MSTRTPTTLPSDLHYHLTTFLSAPDDDPFPFYEQIRAVGPVVRTDLGFWLVTGMPEALEILRNDEDWSRDAANSNVDELIAVTDGTSYSRRIVAVTLLWMDDPEHTRLRRILAPLFAPRSVKNLQDRVRAAVMDQYAHATTGRTAIDLVAEYFLPLPTRVIMSVLGVPYSSDRFGLDRFLALSDAFVAVNEPHADAARAATADRLFEEAGEYVLELAARRRAEPGHDLLTLLVQANIDGVYLTDDELVGMIILLVTAGHETTANLLGTFTHHLLVEPAPLAALQADPAARRSRRGTR